MSGDIEKLGVVLELTADAHSRKVMYHGDFIGTLLFHDWIFKLDLGPAVPLRLDVAQAIMSKANGDESIKHQKLVDERNTMAKNARTFLREKGVEDTMTDQEAVQRYLEWK